MKCPLMSVKSFHSIECFSSYVSLLILCLYDLSIEDSRVLKSLTILVLESICPLRYNSIFCIYLGGLVLGTHMFMIAISS